MVTGPPPAQGPHVSSPSALPPGTRLGEFELLRVLGVGGFGIVYLALDHDLEREVAVKEYMPASLAGRTETLHVSLRSQSDAETFALGLRSFVNEARLLARFDHPSLLKVHRYWEANGTAYMAMPVLRGRTVKEVRQQMAAPPDEAWLRALLDPLLGAIERLHAEGVYHRDIAPDNIQIEPDGRPVLLDFGAARRVIGDKSQTLTAILKPAYAPIEQYAEAGSVRQGPWTDFYALGATLHYLLLLRPPPPATARAVHDDAQPLASMQLPGCSPAFLQTIDWMLAPRPADRPQSVAELREVLAGRRPPPQRRAAEPPSGAWERTAVLPPAAAASAGEPVSSTRVLPRSQPPPRAATSAGPPTAPRQAAAPVPPAESPPAASVPAPASRSRLVPVLLGLIVVAVIGAVAFWPRPSAAPVYADRAGQGSGQAAVPAAPAPAPTAAAPPAAAPAVADAAASAEPAVPAVPMADGGTTSPPAATVATQEAEPPAAREPMVASPAATVTSPPAATVTARPPAAIVAAPAVPARADPGPAPARTPTAAGPPPPRTPAPARAAATEPAPRPAATPRSPPAATVQADAPRPREPARAAAEPPAYGAAQAPGYGAAPGVAAAPPAAAPPAAEPPQQVAGPEARCGGRNPFSYFACMERECWRADFQQHPDCLAWRKEARRR